MKRITPLLIVLVAIMFCTGMANASILTYTQTFSTGPSTSPFSTVFTLNPFNSTWGSLTGVAVTFATTSSAEIDVLNTLATAQAFTNASSSVPLSLSGPASLLINLTAVATGLGGNVGAAAGGVNGAASVSGGTVLNSATANPSPNLAVWGVAVPMSFTAAGSSGTYSGTAANGVFFSGKATVSSLTTLVYTYDTGTPEPASFLILGSGLIGLAFARRRLAAKN